MLDPEDKELFAGILQRLHHRMDILEEKLSWIAEGIREERRTVHDERRYIKETLEHALVMQQELIHTKNRVLALENA